MTPPDIANMGSKNTIPKAFLRYDSCLYPPVSIGTLEKALQILDHKNQLIPPSRYLRQQELLIRILPFIDVLTPIEYRDYTFLNQDQLKMGEGRAKIHLNVALGYLGFRAHFLRVVERTRNEDTSGEASVEELRLKNILRLTRLFECTKKCYQKRSNLNIYFSEFFCDSS